MKTTDPVHPFTPKQRMLNAYRGLFSDRWPVAPEFWYLLPARLLGVSMVEFEREVPFWQALQTTFTHYGCEGWGAAFPVTHHPDAEKRVQFEKIPGTQYRETTTTRFHGRSFTTIKMFDEQEPSWLAKHMADGPADLSTCLDLLLAPETSFDFTEMNRGYRAVGEDYLLEFWLGTPFFDFIAEILGFENAIMYFTDTDEAELLAIRGRYLEFQLGLIREACAKTGFESFIIGCSYSCNSLIGPNMWRQWDKPYIKAMAEELHRHGKLLHIHFHGRSLETVADFAEIGIDCVCPFERGPGGDIDDLEDLIEVRRQLGDRVTMNGNVHTVETLIRGKEADVRREVRQIKEAFTGSARLIIGTGDQVGRETPDENIWAMIDEAKSGQADSPITNN